MIRDENEIKLAWEVWKFLNSLNDMIWNFYEHHFMEFYSKEEERKSWEVPQEDDDSSEVDF